MTDTPDAVDVHVGHAIRARRKEVGISQEKLADAIGLTFQQVQKYERAANRVSCSVLVRIAKALDCGPAEFLPGNGIGAEPRSPSAAVRLAGERGGLELAATYLALEPRCRLSLLTVAGVMMEATTPPEREAPRLVRHG